MPKPLRRFYLEDLSDKSLILTDDEAHHAHHVFKLAVDDQLIVFDGFGRERTATITRATSSSLSLECTDDIKSVDRRPNAQVSVALAFPKSRGRSMITEKLVELGIRKIIPLTSQRSVPPLG